MSRGPVVVRLALLVLAGCRPAAPAAAPVEVEPPEGRLPDGVLRSLIGEAERARGLELLEPIEALAISDEELAAFIEEELSETELELSRRILVAFGFVPAELDLHETLARLLGAEVVGLYDPRTGRLMVRRAVADRLGDGSPESLMARMVLVHELTHALQDQHFETLDSMDEEAWSDDAEAVLTCLAEGGATLTMLLSTLRRAGAPDRTVLPGFRAELRRSGARAIPGSEAMREAPPYFAHVMAAAYFEGAGFAAELRSVGGWDLVNQAHRDPPRATRDVLHTEAWLEGRRVVEVALPERLPPLDEAAYRPVAEAVLGELETGAFLLPLEDGARLWSAADGWAGDRFAVYDAPDGSPALVWRIRFGTVADAEEFVAAAVEVAERTLRGPCEPRPLADGGEEARGEARWCAAGRDWVEARGAGVVVLRHMPDEAAGRRAAASLFAAGEAARAGSPRPEQLARWRAIYGGAEAGGRR